jgi:hypothetical protein
MNTILNHSGTARSAELRPAPEIARNTNASAPRHSTIRRPREPRRHRRTTQMTRSTAATAKRFA